MDRQQIKLLFSYLFSNSKKLTSLQHKFVSSLNEQYRLTGVLTKRQTESLCELRDYIESVLNEPEMAYEGETDKYIAQYSSFDYSTAVSFAAD
jgi:hypothetical protein